MALKRCSYKTQRIIFSASRKQENEIVIYDQQKMNHPLNFDKEEFQQR